MSTPRRCGHCFFRKRPALPRERRKSKGIDSALCIVRRLVFVLVEGRVDRLAERGVGVNASESDADSARRGWKIGTSLPLCWLLSQGHEKHGGPKLKREGQELSCHNLGSGHEWKQDHSLPCWEEEEEEVR